ncbi:17363_t:CDS:2 [Funneliformis geosporum]|uniref:17363_t:CDS:1 n=1 Tax=Funneliformis geosporum TaxID=1117311 RepID=A0A9W4SPB6_9GLOM|nr:17363_t:CDS:2 [Funneliformis geosporum]
MIEFAQITIKKTPMLISTAISHYREGPPQPSWDLKFHLVFAFIKSMFNDFCEQTIEQAQKSSFRPIPVLNGLIINESKVDNKYRHEAQIHLERILKPYEHVLDTEWKDIKDDGIIAEWVQVPKDGWEKREIKKTILYLHGGAYYLCNKTSHRKITCTLAKDANARVFVIDYRLAPQNQFPAALHDALAAYLYLLNPPKDAGFEPLNPKNIIIAGDSAGGGLSMALGLAIRDAGLPSCAGIVGWSPWVDLTLSMQSVLNDECEETDYISSVGFRHKTSKVEIDYKRKAAELTARIKKQNLEPKIWHDSFDRPEGRVLMYAPNEAMAIPYVSPMLADSLCDLPPLFLVVGGGERLRDESIYLAHRCVEPTKYKGPHYNAGKFEKSPFQTPTNTTLDLYEEMPHVFQMFESHPSSKVSIKRTIEFINRLTDTNELLPPSSFNRINCKGEINPLNENDKEVLKWKNIGILPSPEPIVTKVTSRKLTPEVLIYISLLLAIVAYFV